MTGVIYIDYLPGLLRAANLSDEGLDDLLILRDDKPTYVGNIYVGKILSIDKGLDAAFVDIGLSSPGFLPRNEIPKSLREQGISEGLYLKVTVTREGADGKGVKVKALNDKVEKQKINLYSEIDPLYDWLHRQPVEFDEVQVTDASLVRRVKGLLSDLGRGDVNVKFVPENPMLFEANGIEEAVEELLQVDVPLPSGGSLIIEQGRTLTAVDVNKGSMQHNGGAEKLHSELNEEAAKEIARQLRLRNIAGRILIDFPNMKSTENRKRLQGVLKAELKKDYARHKLFPLYLSGLQELTRKRAGHSLQGLLLQPIGIGGLGCIADPLTLGFSALRSLWAGALSSKQQGIPKISAGPMTIKVLEQGKALQYVQDRIGCSILLSVDPTLSAEELGSGFHVEF
ncbi:ribonuclease E/G [Kiloniella sp.]|uniref:ribonuclease E/G n=1 Tax=Kiloniella sp. TaxID=1938587 RepID=UPI003B012004